MSIIKTTGIIFISFITCAIMLVYEALAYIIFSLRDVLFENIFSEEVATVRSADSWSSLTIDWH